MGPKVSHYLVSVSDNKEANVHCQMILKLDYHSIPNLKRHHRCGLVARQVF